MDKVAPNAQNVVSMTDYSPETGFAAISQIEGYWEALRGTRLLPQRSEIDPRGIEMALENAFILERIAPGIARLRVAGSHLTELMGMEVRGMPLTSFFMPPARRVIADALEEVFQTPATCSFRLHAEGGPGRAALDARMVLLPLKSDLGDVSRVLGGFVAKGEIGNAPRRFDIRAHEFCRLITEGSTLPARTPAQPPAKVPTAPVDAAPEPQSPPKALPARRPDAPATGGLAETGVPFEAPAGRGRPPYLRLIKSDD